MMFKAGDRVRRKEEFLEDKWWRKVYSNDPALKNASFVIKSTTGSSLMLQGLEESFYYAKFELCKPPLTKSLSDYS